MNESKIKTNPFKSTRKKIADIDSGMNMFSNLPSKQFDRKQGGESDGKANNFKNHPKNKPKPRDKNLSLEN